MLKRVKLILNDIQLLDTPCLMARLAVEDAVTAVMQADPAGAALLDELVRLQPRVTMLRQAVGNTFGQWDAVDKHTIAAGAPPLCPWKAARDRLASDPDARLPMPDDVFAEPPPRSAA